MRESITPEFITCGFKKCCISNFMDGMEKNVIYGEDEVAVIGTSDSETEGNDSIECGKIFKVHNI